MMHHESAVLLQSFDFHDGEVIRVTHDGNKVIILFRNWQEKLFELIFVNTIALRIFDFPLWPELIIESATSNLLAQEALQNMQYVGCNNSELTSDKYLVFSLKTEAQPLTIVFESASIVEVNAVVGT